MTPNTDSVTKNNHSYITGGKTVWPFLIKLNIQLLYGPAFVLLGIYLSKMEIHVHTKTLYANIHWNLIYDSFKLETTQMPFNSGMDRQIVVYPCFRNKY